MTNYLIYFDSTGVHNLVNLTNIDKKGVWTILKGNTPTFKTDLYSVLLQAKSNKTNNPEVWKFTTDIDSRVLNYFSVENSLELINFVRKHGERIL